MRQLLAIFLLSIFLIPGLSKIKMVIDFKINQEYISQVLCINKDKPSLMCYGKCFLGKQLQEITDHENNDLPNQLNQVNQTLLFIKPTLVNIYNKQENKKESKIFLDQQSQYSSSYLKDIFHPPQLI